MLLYDRSNQPYRVYDPAQVKALLKQGFTKEPKPGIKLVSQVVRPPVSITQEVAKPSASATQETTTTKASEPLVIKVNTCTTAELTVIPKIGAAKARKIEEARPILDVGALLDLFPDQPWMNLTTHEGQSIKLDFSET